MLFPEFRVQVDVLVYIVCHVGVELCEGHCLMLFLALSHQKWHLLPWHRYRRCLWCKLVDPGSLHALTAEFVFTGQLL